MCGEQLPMCTMLCTRSVCLSSGPLESISYNIYAFPDGCDRMHLADLLNRIALGKLKQSFMGLVRHHMMFPEVLAYALIPVPPMRYEGSPILPIQHMPHRLQDPATLQTSRNRQL